MEHNRVYQPSSGTVVAVCFDFHFWWVRAWWQREKRHEVGKAGCGGGELGKIEEGGYDEISWYKN